jgi:hypothetical protein
MTKSVLIPAREESGARRTAKGVGDITTRAPEAP